jgi:predicted transcriptional regulator
MTISSSKGQGMADEQANSPSNPIELATELTIAWLSNPNVRATAEEVPAFLRKMHETIGELSKPPQAETVADTPEHVPAVPVRSSVKPDYIISLIDGRKMKSLKRHLATHGLTSKEYRERYGLKPDYPMVAPNYSAHRREVAQKLGLGRKGRAAATPVEAAPVVTAPVETPEAVSAVPPPVAKAPRKAATPKADATPKPARRARAKKTEVAS